MIKIGVSIDDSPVKEYLDLLSGENPFLISGFSHSVNSKINNQSDIQKNSSFISLLENSDAILFLEGKLMEYDKINYALKKFKHVFLTRINTIPRQKLLEFQKLASEANVVLKAANPILFNPAYISCKQELVRPRFIEIKRKEVPAFRTKEDIAKDLAMDLEFVFMITNSTPKKVFTSGSVSTAEIPVFINSRVELENGASANISYDFLQSEQKHTAIIHLYEQSFFINFRSFETHRNRLNEGEIPSEQIISKPVALITDAFSPGGQNPFQLEMIEFYESISGIKDPSITFDNSLMALDTAKSVLNNIHVPKSNTVS